MTIQDQYSLESMCYEARMFEAESLKKDLPSLLEAFNSDPFNAQKHMAWHSAQDRLLALFRRDHVAMRRFLAK